MTRVYLLVLAVWTGCVRDRTYLCGTDADCNLGDTGRCEVDGRCTDRDLDCPSSRRYSEHSGELTGTCFDDAVTPTNACASGQPPARRDGCFARVCDALPACCDTGWSEACVQHAQALSCPEARCDTRLAITATVGGVATLLDLRSIDGQTWDPSTPIGTRVAWLAPAPSSSEPRLARIDGPTLFIESSLGVDEHPLAERTYFDVASVDFERDGRDTIVLSSSDPAHFVEVLDLTRQRARREFSFSASRRLEWADHDHDAFPDVVASNANHLYFLGDNVDSEGVRVLSSVQSNLDPARTAGQVPDIRGFVWSDLDGDRALDLIVTGNSIRIHLTSGRNPPTVQDSGVITADCHPLSTAVAMNCVASGDPAGATASSFAVTAIPRTGSSTEIAIAAFPQLEVTSIAHPDLFAVQGTIDFSATRSLVVLVARDVNQDGLVDLIGIDQQLGIWTRLGNELGLTQRHPGTGTDFAEIRVSASGRPL